MIEKVFSRLFVLARERQPLRGLLLFLYFLRFIFYSIKEKSLFFLRYYPGYHGSTIPSLKYLSNNEDLLFLGDALDAVNLNEDGQLLLLREFLGFFEDFDPPGTKCSESLYFYRNNMFGFNDGFVLYCFLRKFKPRRIVEIGSGYSSALMIDVCRNILPDTELTFVDPYSTKILEVMRDSPGLKVKYLRQEIQRVSLECFLALQADDILFIDTSHVVKVGSDLSAIFFRIIPGLNPGVIVHIHDIWYPFEYPQEMMFEGRCYNEAYFVRSFLQYNSSFEMMFFSSFLESRYKDEFRRTPGYFKDTGKSLWIRKIA